MNELSVKNKARDGEIWRDDCVELFLDPDHSESAVYQFVINPIGALFGSYRYSRSENIMCQTAAKIFHGRGYWCCEFAVAAKDLHGRKIDADSIWGINIIRARIGPASEHCAFWPTFGWAHRFHLFAIAVFDGLESDDGSVSEKAVAD